MVSERLAPTGSQQKGPKEAKIGADGTGKPRIPLNGECLSFVVGAAATAVPAGCGGCSGNGRCQERLEADDSSNHDDNPECTSTKQGNNVNAVSSNNNNDNEHNSKLRGNNNNNSYRISSSRRNQVIVRTRRRRRSASASGSGSQVEEAENAINGTRDEAQDGLLVRFEDSPAFSWSTKLDRAALRINASSDDSEHKFHQSVKHGRLLFTSPPTEDANKSSPRKPEGPGRGFNIQWRKLNNPQPRSSLNNGNKSKDLNQAYTCPQYNNYHRHYRWPPHKPRGSLLALLLLLLFLPIGLSSFGGLIIVPSVITAAAAAGGTPEANGHRHWEPQPLSIRRVSRQILASNNWRSANSGQQQQQQLPVAGAAGGNQQNVPYKTFYVTRACEWKSNLFVPKSNDIHFAQPIVQGASVVAAATATIDHQRQQAQQVGESSVAYETFNSASSNNNNNANSNYARGGAGGGSSQFQQDSLSRTMLTTDSKALILALPIVMGQSFAGYESACSIRLIVPRNMRILAKLTSRRLTFDQQQLEQPQQLEPPDNNLDNNYEPQGLNQQQQQQRHQQQQPPPSLWLNVSQNQFTETEHRIIETEGNVLAFRFLLERFASKQIPDIRFQVVLTAFQTLSENSDWNGASQTSLSSSSRPSMDSNQQFICDQQRLISANLACDGFRNCQDGHDEELATCLSLRASQTPEHGIIQTNNELQPPIIRDQTSGTIDQQLTGSGDQAAGGPVWVRTWHYVRDTNSLAGFFVGFLVVLALLTCCSCCTFLAYMLYQHRWRPYRERQRRRNELAAAGQEADHLAASQNNENAARQRLAATSKQPHPPPSRLQSILKRPVEPPPAVPERQSRGGLGPASQEGSQKRGALSSSISRGQVRTGSDLLQFRPTPAQRLTRPTRPVPLPVTSRHSTTETHWPPTGSKIQPPIPTTSTRVTSGQQQQQLAPQKAAPSQGTTTTSVTGTQRITTYHYSSGTTRLSESYLQRLVAEQHQSQSKSATSAAGAAATPPGDTNVDYRREPSSVSPQSSLI